MQNSYTILTDFIEKAVQISQACLKAAEENDYLKLDELVQNRERVVNIILSLHERLDLEQRNEKDPAKREFYINYNNQVNLLLVEIGNLEEKLLLKLGEEKDKTQIEIAKTFKNKENLKGYNLNCLK